MGSLDIQLKSARLPNLISVWRLRIDLEFFVNKHFDNLSRWLSDLVAQVLEKIPRESLTYKRTGIINN